MQKFRKLISYYESFNLNNNKKKQGFISTRRRFSRQIFKKLNFSFHSARFLANYIFQCTVIYNNCKGGEREKKKFEKIKVKMVDFNVGCLITANRYFNVFKKLRKQSQMKNTIQTGEISRLAETNY